MTEMLQKVSDGMADVVTTAGPAVVRVDGRRRLSASGVVWSDDGLVVTAHHVVERDEGLKLGLPNGDTVAAELVGRDPTTDLALLRAEASGLGPVAWSDLEDLKVGHFVLALGRPGKTVQATLGIVSALGGEWRSPGGGLVDRYLQTDVVMYPGFSGGPLVDVSGEVLGITTSALMRGVSLTVPTPTVRRVVDTLLAHGRVRRGYLGVAIQPAKLPKAVAEQTGQDRGLLIVSVEPDSPAEKGGLVLGDTIMSVDGDGVRGMDHLLAALGGDRVGQSVPLTIVRGGQVQEISVVVGERK